ncbi:MAG: hypothetical protein WAU32_15845 [Thermoanaerobaculia bacterium]
MKILAFMSCGLLALLAADAAQAQMKLSGKMQCAKPDPNYAVTVGDGADHALTLGVQKCTWTEGELGGERLKEETDSVVSDIRGSMSHDRGYGVGDTANGDKYFVRFEGTSTVKNHVLADARCTWTFTGGTGQLAKLSGKGTCKGTFAADGSSSFDIEGEYRIHKAATKK